MPLLLLQLLEESAAEVRSVNLCVAIDARKQPRMGGDPVTLGTQLPGRTVFQKELIGRAMRDVADGAPFRLLGQMLVDPGPSFFRVTIETNLVLRNGVRLSQPRPVAGPVGV